MAKVRFKLGPPCSASLPLHETCSQQNSVWFSVALLAPWVELAAFPFIASMQHPLGGVCVLCSGIIIHLPRALESCQATWLQRELKAHSWSAPGQLPRSGQQLSPLAAPGWLREPFCRGGRPAYTSSGPTPTGHTVLQTILQDQQLCCEPSIPPWLYLLLLLLVQPNIGGNDAK